MFHVKQFVVTLFKKKSSLVITFLICLILGCSRRNIIPLNNRVEQFQVSECRNDCSIDSIGIRTNKIENKNLKVSLGYILNCSWKQAFFKNIIEKNDTLIVELDRPHSENGEYPITDCDCFFYFDFGIRDYHKIPKAIRVVDIFTKDKFWDETAIYQMEVEETIPAFLNEVEETIIQSD